MGHPSCNLQEHPALPCLGQQRGWRALMEHPSCSLQARLPQPYWDLQREMRVSKFQTHCCQHDFGTGLGHHQSHQTFQTPASACGFGMSNLNSLYRHESPWAETS